MKITPINYSYNYSNIQTKSQNFEGLWGKTSRNTDFDKVLGVPTVRETYYYYPFSDETTERINQVVSENTDADIVEENGNFRYMIKDCKICTTLPFKEVNFDTYSAMDSSSRLTKNARVVHYCAKNKYITNQYGNEQVSAANDAVAQKLMDLKV